MADHIGGDPRNQCYLVTHDIHFVQLAVVVDELLQAARHCHLQPTKLLQQASGTGRVHLTLLILALWWATLEHKTALHFLQRWQQH